MPRIEFFASPQEVLQSLESLYASEPFCWAAQKRTDDTALTGTENPLVLEQQVANLFRLSIAPGQSKPLITAAEFPLQHGLIYGLMPRQYDYLAKGGFYLDKGRYIGDYEGALHLYKALVKVLRRSFVRIPYDAGVERPLIRNDVYFSPWAKFYLKDGGVLESG